jgi:hypothetical protein
VINELNANIAGGCDLIELRVTQDGSLGGFTLTERVGNTSLSSPELNFAFPQGFNVTKNAIVVVHINSGSATCNPKGATQELTSPTGQLAASFTGNYDTAFDFWSNDDGLVATDNVITLDDVAGNIVDAVLVESATSGAADTLAQGNKVAAAGQWSPGPTANGMYAASDFATSAVPGLKGTGTAASGTSLQRNVDADSNTKGDWVTAAQTFGTINAGQAALPAAKRRRQ